MSYRIVQMILESYVGEQLLHDLRQVNHQEPCTLTNFTQFPAEYVQAFLELPAELSPPEKILFTDDVAQMLSCQPLFVRVACLELVQKQNPYFAQDILAKLKSKISVDDYQDIVNLFNQMYVEAASGSSIAFKQLLAQPLFIGAFLLALGTKNSNKDIVVILQGIKNTIRINAAPLANWFIVSEWGRDGSRDDTSVVNNTLGDVDGDFEIDYYLSEKIRLSNNHIIIEDSTFTDIPELLNFFEGMLGNHNKDIGDAWVNKCICYLELLQKYGSSTDMKFDAIEKPH